MLLDPVTQIKSGWVGPESTPIQYTHQGKTHRRNTLDYAINVFLTHGKKTTLLNYAGQLFQMTFVNSPQDLGIICSKEKCSIMMAIAGHRIMRENRLGIRQWLAAIAKAHCFLRDIRERDNTWELTKTIFQEGAISKWEIASHSGGTGDYLWDCQLKEVLTVSPCTWYIYCCMPCHQRHVQDHAPEYRWVFRFASFPETLHIGPEKGEESRSLGLLGLLHC